MTPAIENLARLLPVQLPAHTVHGTAEQAGAADYLYIQGRQDRLHGFWIFDDGSVDEAASANETPCNWFWVVCPSASPPAAALALAEKLGAGVLLLGDTAMTKVVNAPPRPGIHMKRHPELRSEWKQMSDF
jgi:hypothetical protein